MLSFARDLNSTGWTVDVICPLNTAEKRRDKKLIQKVPREVNVFRVPHLDISGYQATWRENEALARHVGNQFGRSPSRRLMAAAKHLKRAVFFPDIHVAWYPMLLPYAAMMCSRRRYSAILATGDPWSVVAAGAALAKRFKIAFAADFRELWSGHSQALHQNLGLFERVRRSEQWIFRNTRLIIANSPMECQILQESCEAFPGPRFVSIENGFDPHEISDLFSAVAISENTGPFTIAYAGSFQYRRPDAFFSAVSSWLRDEPHLQGAIKVRIAGPIEHRVVNLVSELGITDVVEFLGYLPHGETLSLLAQSHVLLAIVGTPRSRESDPTVPAKLYEYSALGRPVLLMAKPGGASRFLEGVGNHGAVVDNESPSAIRSALQNLYSRYRQGDLPVVCDRRVGEYTREAASRRLSHCLREIAGLPADGTVRN
jgi:glycosyltransferase involved in cell wall biosynthesis